MKLKALFCFSLFLAWQSAYACTCQPKHTTLEGKFNNSRHVTLVQVIDGQVTEGENEREFQYQLKPLESFKGDWNQMLQTKPVTGMDSCSTLLVVGEIWLVFHDGSELISFGSCRPHVSLNTLERFQPLWRWKLNNMDDLDAKLKAENKKKAKLIDDIMALKKVQYLIAEYNRGLISKIINSVGTVAQKDLESDVSYKSLRKITEMYLSKIPGDRLLGEHVATRYLKQRYTSDDLAQLLELANTPIGEKILLDLAVIVAENDQSLDPHLLYANVFRPKLADTEQP
ncbi:MAG: hypothetical protein HWE27_18540 [Gammaproteobacteria bacterium]|nr:hypothetical protein [Gammaproteobacteria bacterium]